MEQPLGTRRCAHPTGSLLSLAFPCLYEGTGLKVCIWVAFWWPGASPCPAHPLSAFPFLSPKGTSVPVHLFGRTAHPSRPHEAGTARGSRRSLSIFGEVCLRFPPRERKGSLLPEGEGCGKWRGENANHMFSARLELQGCKRRGNKRSRSRAARRPSAARRDAARLEGGLKGSEAARRGAGSLPGLCGVAAVFKAGPES